MSRAEEFNVDDVVEVYALQNMRCFNGRRGVIMEPLQFMKGFDDTTCGSSEDYRYVVQIDGMGTGYFKPEYLRKPDHIDAASCQEAADLIARLTRVHAFEKVGKA